MEHFQDRTLEVLDHNPEELLTLKGFTQKRVDKIIAVWQQYRSPRQMLLFLIQHGLPMAKARRVLKALEGSDFAEFQANPYRLLSDTDSLRVPGLGFKTVDRLARSCGIDPYSPSRIQAGILYLIRNGIEQYGHSCIPKKFIEVKVPNFLELLPKRDWDLDACLDQMEKQEDLIAVQGSLSDLNSDQRRILASFLSSEEGPVTFYYLPKYLRLERLVAEKIEFALSRNKEEFSQELMDRWLVDMQSELGLSLHGKQKEAVYGAMVQPLFVLTGGAGVGKTTTLRAILWMSERLDQHVALATPTGRAAQRIKELTGQSAKTVHRLLEWQPHEFKFGRNAQKPLSEDLVIVDESSMVDLSLAGALMEAISFKRTRLVLMGDPHQLPSVGPGCVLADLLASQVIPSITLTEVFRQARYSPIIQASQSLLDGQVPDFCRKASPPSIDSESWCYYEHHANPEEIPQAILNILRTRWSEESVFSDVQILTPVNKGNCGCDGLNQFLQHYFQTSVFKNPRFLKLSPPHPTQRSFYPKDKVIQTVNNYHLNVFNGDIGYVVHCEFDGKNQLDSIMVQFQDTTQKRAVTYSKADLKELRLAYAITIHKSQGSEFSSIVVPIMRHHKHMLSSHLLYTALTRAKNHVVFLGDVATLQEALVQKQQHPRYTRLAQLLSETKKELEKLEFYPLTSEFSGSTAISLPS